MHEIGVLLIWLQRGMTQLRLPATCIDACKAHKCLSARLKKSGVADAERLALLAWTGWFNAVRISSEEAERLLSLVGTCERSILLHKGIEGHVRGVLKRLGIRMIRIKHGRNRRASRDRLAAAGGTDPVLRASDALQAPREFFHHG